MNGSIAARLAPEASPSSAQTAPRRTVLLVDDELSVREITTLFLRQLQFDVLEAGNIEEALGVGLSHPGPIDLLITDLRLGGGDGRALAREFSLLRPQVRVLFISGSDEDDVPPQAGQRFLCKPFLISDLQRITGDLLD